MGENLIESFRGELPTFFKAAKEYFDGELPKKDYKGISGGFGCYAQREDDKCMLRLRMTAGSMPKDKLKFIVDSAKKYHISKIHFTTCQAVQLHNLGYKALTELAEAGYDHGIITRGTGGDNPRNTMCSPLSGVEKGEYFDVMPYAKAAGEYALTLIHQGKIPRKYKVVFSNSPKNASHATFHDIGFVARSDGKFDVYTSGGLGPNPRMGVLIDTAVDPKDICYYIYAQWKTFSEHGNYQNRGRARTRYLIELCGGEEEYKKVVYQNLADIRKREDLTLHIQPSVVTKTGDGTTIEGDRVIAQKQEGLYAVEWHTVGGCPQVDELEKLYETIKNFEDVEVRLGSYETAYIINLTASEAKKVLEATKDSAVVSEFEHSVSCIGASICQVGLRNSQALLRACVDAVREAKLSKTALPLCHISGCPSSCGTHQIGVIGFRGAAKKGKPAYQLTINGDHYQGKERFGDVVGDIFEEDVPRFLVKLGQTVDQSNLSFYEWNKKNPDAVVEVAREFLVE